MSSGDFFGLWLHLLGLVVYAGGTIALIAFVIPAARRAETAHSGRAFLANALRIYDPLMIAALGVILMSGAVNLTSYKVAMRAEFFARMGWLLVWKLVFAFLVLLIGVCITFGLSHRIVRNEQLEEVANEEWLRKMGDRLIYANVLNLILLAITVWFGLAIGHPTITAGS